MKTLCTFILILILTSLKQVFYYYFFICSLTSLRNKENLTVLYYFSKIKKMIITHCKKNYIKLETSHFEIATKMRYQFIKNKKL